MASGAMRFEFSNIQILLVITVIYLFVVGAVYGVYREERLGIAIEENSMLSARVVDIETSVEVARDDLAELYGILGFQVSEQRNFESLYVEQRSMINELVDELISARDALDVAREERLTAEEERNAIYTQLQSVSLQLVRMSVRLDECAAELLSCESALCR